jgi:hypothetical protein
MSDVDTIRWNELCYSPDDLVFEAGSNVEGFANHKTDIDVYLIYDEKSKSASHLPKAPIDYHTVVGIAPSGQALDVEIYPFAWMVELATSINAVPFDSFERIADLHLEDLNRYYRTSIGAALWNEERLRSLKAHFSREHISKLFSIWCGMHCARKLNSSLDHIKEGRERHAFVDMREAIMFAVDSYLAANGEGFTSRKFRFSKIKRLGSSESELYKRTWSLRSLGEQSYQQYVQTGDAFIKDLGVHRYLVHEKAYNARKASDVELFEIGDQHYLVKNKTYIYRVDKTSAHIWEHCDGSRTERDLAMLLLRADMDVGKGDADTIVKRFVRDAAKSELLQKQYAPGH